MIWRRLDEISSVGLPLLITELSFSTFWNDVGPRSDLSEFDQSNQLKNALALFYSHPAIQGITLWGFWDGNVWGNFSGIYRPDFTPKLAAGEVKKFWREVHNTTVVDEAVAPATAGPYFSFRGHYGRYAYEAVNSRGERVEGELDLVPGGPPFQEVYF
jgi:GH35 family endo-1,4-beta-xylanase